MDQLARYIGSGVTSDPIVLTDEDEAENYIWHCVMHIDDTLGCPMCGLLSKLYAVNAPIRGGQMKCGECGYKWTYYTHTFMGNTKLAYRTIIQACAILVNEPRIPSTQLALRLGVTQKTAYYFKRRVMGISDPA